MPDQVHPQPEKLAYRIDEAVKASGLGRTFLYERIASGELKSVKIGGRRLILKDDLLLFITAERAHG
jgi:excisionase family DNA binding protein